PQEIKSISAAPKCNGNVVVSPVRNCTPPGPPSDMPHGSDPVSTLAGFHAALSEPLRSENLGRTPAFRVRSDTEPETGCGGRTGDPLRGVVLRILPIGGRVRPGSLLLCSRYLARRSACRIIRRRCV